MLPMLCFASKTPVNKPHVKEGDWWIRYPDDSKVLGKVIDFSVLAVRAKAVNLTDKDNIVETYDQNSPVFYEIADFSIDNHQYMVGWELLVAVLFPDNDIEVARFFLASKGAKKAFRDSIGNPTTFEAGCDHVIRAASSHVETANYQWRSPNFTLTRFKWDKGDDFVEELKEFWSLKGNAKLTLFDEDGMLQCPESLRRMKEIEAQWSRCFDTLLERGCTKLELRAYCQELQRQINTSLELCLHP